MLNRAGIESKQLLAWFRKLNQVIQTILKGVQQRFTGNWCTENMALRATVMA